MAWIFQGDDGRHRLGVYHRNSGLVRLYLFRYLSALCAGATLVFGLFEKKAPAKPIKVAAEVITDAFVKLGAKEEKIWHKDPVYTQFDEAGIKALTYKYHDTSRDDYFKDDLMDCDDFVTLAMADMIRGQNRERLDAPVIFGQMDYKRKKGGRHMVNVTVTDLGKVLIYEPQRKKWTADTSDIESIRHIQF